MRLYLAFIVVLHCFFIGIAQNSIEKTLRLFNSGDIPYITVNELKNDTISVILDTRKKEEFNVSHISNAHWVGFKKVDIDQIKKQIPDTSTPLVVYCSIGVRSEKIGKKLKTAGYTNIRNLYGGIFQWKKENNIVVDTLGQSTERVHAFSKHWGKLLTNAEKVYTSKKKAIEQHD